MGLVGTWLQGIGLTYAVPTFQAAGIDSPAALALLDVSYFEGLGVTDPEDRRKLFFLVQRIKMAVEQREDSSANAVDAVLAKNSLRSHDLQDLKGKEAAHSPNSPQAKENNRPGRQRQRQRKQQQKPEILHMDQEDAIEIVKMNSASSDWTADEDGEDGDDYNEEDEDDSVQQQKQQQQKQPPPPVQQKPSVVTTRRRSARLMQKEKSSESLSELSSASSSASATTSTSANMRTSRLAPPRKTSLGARRKADTHLLRGSKDTASAAADTTTTTLPRNSGLPASGRRSVMPSMSTRTGKQLSTIPSNEEAPMSPLVDLALTQETQKQTEEQTQRQGKNTSHVTTRRSRTSMSRNNDDDDNSNDSSNDNTSTGRSNSSSRRSSSGLPRRNLHSTTLSSNTRKSNHFGDRSRSSSASSNNTQPRRVTVQGRKPDTSFKAQIQQLRQDNDGDYELFDRPNDLDTADPEEMRIRVVVRKRPMSRSEIAAAGDVDVIHPLDYGNYGRVMVYSPKTRVDLTKSIETLPFAFDNVFDETCTNVQIYERSVRHLIPSIFDGQWASVFAYGQTGSGKTFTMMGSNATGMNDPSVTTEEQGIDPSNLGLYYMAALDLFQAIATPGFEEFRIEVSLFEIYSGKLFDLLNDKQQIKCLEDSKGKVCFPGLTEHAVESADDLMELIEQGGRNRSTGTTSRNADSSRSHAVLQLHLKTADRRGKDVEHSRLTFIDLAGSERGADTATASRATRLEGSEINTSLLALKEVIRALATGDSMAHVPFRGSKLTQVLKESFVGKDGRSVMIACVSPNIGNVETTLNTLRYADRVKERDAKTGELSIVVVDKPRKSAIGSIGGVRAPTRPTERGPIRQIESFHSVESNTSDVLDELLSSPQKTSPSKTTEDNFSEEDRKENEAELPSTRKIALRLIDDHKTAMATMLAMVKDEMTIVKEADANRKRLPEYISQINALQEVQLSVIASLREHLLAYRLATSAGSDDDSDDSFEDLRD